MGATKFVSMSVENLVYREEERGILRSAGCRIGVILESPWRADFLQATARETARRRRSRRSNAKSRGQRIHQAIRHPRSRQRAGGGKGVSGAKIALAWLLHRPVVTAPIVGASKMKHLDDAIALRA